MSKYFTTHNVVFSGANLSAELKIDPRDCIVAIQTPSSYSGNSLAAHFSFDDGASWSSVNDEDGNQIAIISDAALASGSSYSLNQDEWDVTNRLKFNSNTTETCTITVITKPRS